MKTWLVAARAALVLLVVMASLLAITPVFAQSESRTTGYVFPGQTIHIRKNPVLRIGVNANFPSGELIADWDTDQPYEFRVCPEAIVMALPSVKLTDTVGEFYQPMATTAVPWSIRLDKNQTNPFLLPRRVAEDALSQQWEEFSYVGATCTRPPVRKDLFLGDNEKSWWLRVVKGDTSKFKLAGLIQLWGSSRDYATQIGIPIKVERLPKGLVFCEENREVIAHWMRYEPFDLPSAVATPPAMNNSTAPAINPNDAALAAGIAANGRNIDAVNGDLQGFKTQTTPVVNGIATRVEQLEAELAALRANPAPAVVPPAPVPVGVEIKVSGVCDTWYYQVQDSAGIRPHKGPFSLRQGTNMVHFDALSNEGSFNFRVFEASSQKWGEWMKICITPGMAMQNYTFGGAR
jgi:hypothetical protein